MAKKRHRRHAPWAAYLWPGLAHLWIRGSLAGLLLALAFSVLLNVLILTTVVWPEWLETRLKLACALCAGGLWLAALWETRCELRRIAAEREAEDGVTPTAEDTKNDELLRAAQAAYLREEWVEAERALRQAVRRDRRDVEARLWYAGVLRRTARKSQATRRLRRLALLDEARRWRHEIDGMLNEPVEHQSIDHQRRVERTDNEETRMEPPESRMRKAA